MWVSIEDEVVFCIFFFGVIRVVVFRVEIVGVFVYIGVMESEVCVGN